MPHSLVPFRDAATHHVQDTLATAAILANTRDLRWGLVNAEFGRHNGWEANNVVVDGYYLALNMADVPLVIEERGRATFQNRVVPPGTLVVHPYGESFTFHVSSPASWGGVVLRPELVAAATGRTPSLPPSFGTADGTLVHLVKVLLNEAASDGETGPLFAESVGMALAQRLAAIASVKVAPAARGGRFDHVVEHIDAAIVAGDTEGLSLALLAGLAGLSTFHFARSFAQALGVTPHQYVLRRRCALARHLLLTDRSSVTTIAQRTGFADASHLARAYRAHFGESPTETRGRR